MKELFWNINSLKQCSNKNVMFLLQRSLLEKQYFLLSHHLKYSYSQKQNSKMLSHSSLVIDIFDKDKSNLLDFFEKTTVNKKLQQKFQKKWFDLFKQKWIEKNDQDVENNQINIQYNIYSRANWWWFSRNAIESNEKEKLKFLTDIYWEKWYTLKNHERFKIFFDMWTWEEKVALTYSVFDKSKSFFYYSLFNWIYWNISNYFVKKYKHLLVSKDLHINYEHLWFLSPNFNDWAYTSALMSSLSVISSEINNWKKWSKPWLIRDWIKEYQIKWIKNNQEWIFELILDYLKTFYQSFKSIDQNWIYNNFWKIISVLLFMKELKYLSEIENVQDFKRKYFTKENQNEKFWFEELLEKYLKYINKKEIKTIFSKMYDVCIEILKEKWLFKIINEKDLDEYLYIIHCLKSKNYWENLLKENEKDFHKIVFWTFMYSFLKEHFEFSKNYSNSVANSWKNILEIKDLTQHLFN